MTQGHKNKMVVGSLLASFGSLAVPSSAMTETHSPTIKLTSIHWTSTSSAPRSKKAQIYSLEMLKENKRRLEHFKLLATGWDGYNGNPINELLIDKTIALISELAYQPKIYPTPRGSIQMEYGNPSDSYLEIEIFEDLHAEYLKSKAGYDEENSIDIKEIPKIIDEFLIA